MQDELESENNLFKFPKEWCKFQHRQLAYRYNIIPKEVKEANFAVSQRISLFLTHFSIRFTRKIVIVFSAMIVINFIWKQIFSRFKGITKSVLSELEFVLWYAIFIAIALNLITTFIQNRIQNGDYLFNQNPVLLISCVSCNKSGITEDFEICKDCNSLGVNIGNWEQEKIAEKLRANPRWGME